mmetsp:Transcript_34294/g.67521  ORF Transcript_34294/g.67521 Transcript_34294/m.67521 type:complete len:319 (-) Transcript_34294:1996-2952(-)
MCVDILSKPNNSVLHVLSVCFALFVPEDKTVCDVGHFEGFAHESVHVRVHHLSDVAPQFTDRVQMVGCLALCAVPSFSDSQPELPRNNSHQLKRVSDHRLHTGGVLKRNRAALAVGVVARPVLLHINHLFIPRCHLVVELEVVNDRDRVLFEAFEQVVQVISFAFQLRVTFLAVHLGSDHELYHITQSRIDHLPFFSEPPKPHLQRFVVGQRPSDCARDCLCAKGGPQTDLLHKGVGDVGLGQEVLEQRQPIRIQTARPHSSLEIDPFLGVLVDQMLKVGAATVFLLLQVTLPFHNVFFVDHDHLRQGRHGLQEAMVV